MADRLETHIARSAASRPVLWEAERLHSRSQKRTYDSTVARIAGNILSGITPTDIQNSWRTDPVPWAVRLAREIIAETERAELLATQIAWPQDAEGLIAMAREWPMPQSDGGDIFSGDVLIKKLGNALAAVKSERDVLATFIRSHGECHSENCGDDPTLDHEARRAYINAHSDICTCGAVEAYEMAAPRVDESPTS